MATNIEALISDSAAVTQKFIVKVYGWMCLALLITGLFAMSVADNEAVAAFIFSSKYIFYGLLILEVGMVMGLVSMINRMSANTAIILFVLYSVVNGLTLSVIFFAYTTASIASTFFITALTFGVMSAYGYVTKRDLTSIGNILVMALFGLIIASVVNMFLNSETLYWITTYVGIIIFVGLIAYDTQKIKAMAVAASNGEEVEKKAAILGALALYLDFINLFLMLLRVMGNRKS
jgi:uncharacterized protein